MQDIVINLPFDYDSYLEGQKIKWQIDFKKNYSNYIFFYGTTSIILFLFLIILVLGDIKSYPPSFFGIALFLIFYNILIPWISMYKNKLKFFKAAELLAIAQKKTGSVTVLSLNEQSLSIEDAQRSIKMRWTLFQPFYIFKDAIILTSTSIVGNTIIIQKGQIDEATNVQLIELLTKTIGSGKGI